MPGSIRASAPNKRTTVRPPHADFPLFTEKNKKTLDISAFDDIVSNLIHHILY